MHIVSDGHAPPALVADVEERFHTLMLLEQVASIANRSNDPVTLLIAIVKLTSQHFGFLAGNALLREGNEGEVELRGCGAAWVNDPATGTTLADISNRFSTWACATLPGRILLDPAPAFLLSPATHASFSRHREAKAIGAARMIAIPILVDDSIVGALEFFDDVASPPADQLLGVLQHVGGEIAHVFRRVARESALRRDAIRDPITGLPNRAMLEARLAERFAAARNAGRAGPTVMVVEFEGLKHVRDMAGFKASDSLLIDVTHRVGQLVDEFGAADRLLLHYAHDIMFARIGGHDFAISIDGPDCVALTSEIADAIHHSLRALEHNRSGGPAIYPAIGIAHDDGSYSNAEELLRDADFAMYHAQTRGDGRSIIFNQQMRADSQAAAGMVSELKEAVRAHRFVLHYQPIYELDSQSLIGFEALVRWRRDDGTLVMPDSFITLAENNGLIADIGTQALRQACQAIWPKIRDLPVDRRPFVSVNVSTFQFLQSDFLAHVRETLDDTGFDPQSLVLEITESAAVQNLEYSRQLLAELRSWGVRVSLDDFGTGYSSLGHLQTLPLDGIKIDKSFIMSQTVESANWTIVTAILQMAKALDIRVIAEGIESQFQHHQLRALGCAFGQGYLFSRPVDCDGVTLRLAEHRA
jgi:diguanylate cyclase (GGDEF)-like protein